MKPLISVVLPVRNGEAFVDAAVESIRRQTLAELELIVVDDGSQDRTLEIVRGHAAADPRVRLHERPARGLVVALNEGCALASSDVIARMDADDVAEPQRLAKQVETLDREPDTVLLGTAVTQIDNSDRAVAVVRYPEDANDALLTRNRFAHPTVVFRRAAFERVGGYRDLFPHAEDYDLWLRLAEFGRVRNLAEPLLRYRLHEGQVTRLRIEQQVASTLAAQAAARSRRATGSEPLPSALEPPAELVRQHAFAAYVALAASRLDARLLDEAAVLLDAGRELRPAGSRSARAAFRGQLLRLFLRRRVYSRLP